MTLYKNSFRRVCMCVIVFFNLLPFSIQCHQSHSTLTLLRLLIVTVILVLLYVLRFSIHYVFGRYPKHLRYLIRREEHLKVYPVNISIKSVSSTIQINNTYHCLVNIKDDFIFVIIVTCSIDNLKIIHMCWVLELVFVNEVTYS